MDENKHVPCVANGCQHGPPHFGAVSNRNHGPPHFVPSLNHGNRSREINL